MAKDPLPATLSDPAPAAAGGTGVASSKKIAVIDGNSLMHRAYHAVPPTMTAPDGTPTNAVFGFIAMLFKFIEVASPDGIVCAFDAGKPEFRIKAMEQYKAQRPPMDEELRVQFPLVESLLDAMSIPVVKVPGWEGDDILGTVAARDEAAGYETLLVSGDKDVCQLVTDKTHVVNTKKGITDVVIFDPQGVYDKYGVTPAQIPDYLGLMGDTADNIPGVPGIGPKTATKFLQKYGSMEGLYEHLDDLKGKQLERVRDNKDMAFLSRKIATIVTDLDFELNLDDAAWPAFDADTAAAAFHELHFNAHLERLLKLAGSAGMPVGAQGKPAFTVAPAVEGSEATALIEGALAAGQRVAVACFNPEDEEAVPNQGSLFQPEFTLFAATPQGAAKLEGEAALDTLARIVREGSFAALDAKRVLHQVMPRDSAKPALVTEAEALAANLFDVSLAAYVLNSSAGKYPLDQIASRYLGSPLPPVEGFDDKGRAQNVEAVLAWKQMEAQAVCALVDPLRAALDADGSAHVYDDIDAPLVAVLAIMERTGAPVDEAQLAQLGAFTQVEIDRLEQEIYQLAGQEFNIDSPKQLSHILFEVLEYPHGKKTKSGYSTDAKVLTKLAQDYPLPKQILHYRELAKIKSTYIDALPRMAAAYGDGRLHTYFNETVTTTGRLSSSDPNLQNIPVRTDFGRKIRACFGALNPGDKFLSADYSQIELRLLAHLSGDEHLIAAFRSGEDFHAETAARVFGVPVAEVTPQMRSRAKAVNFGIVYGQQAFGLAQSLDIPRVEAQEMIDRYFDAYPQVRVFLDQVVAQAKDKGYAETMFGRKRHIPELREKNAMRRAFGERTAMNHPMQGTAADIIKLAMRQVQTRLVDEGFSAKLMVQVHDELDFSCPPDEVERLSAMVKDVMENVVSLSVPLIADVEYADTWAEAH